MTALVTPFRSGKVDWPRWEPLLIRQIEAGVEWLVPCGTTGESPTLTVDERAKMIDCAVSLAAGRALVMAGTGCNCTAETIQSTQRAAALGADAALVVTPYYNRPTQEGLFQHYAAVALAVDLPIVIYNVPCRTGVSIDMTTIARLAELHPNIVGVKHATGRVDGVTELLARCDLAILSGDDALTWPLMALGATGVISVVSNLAPDLLSSLTEAALANERAKALAAHSRLHALAEALGRLGPNPLPIKTAMGLCGLLEPEFRLPLCPLEQQATRVIDTLLRQNGFLEASAA
jgi:4-hydroxy-tetrahydrodipicolinate synthase